MKLKKLDPKVPYEKLMIEAIELRKKDAVAFYKEVQNILIKAQQGACRKIGIPVDTKIDHNLILATTEDGIIFLSRVDLIVYPGQKFFWMKDLI